MEQITVEVTDTHFQEMEDLYSHKKGLGLPERLIAAGITAERVNEALAEGDRYLSKRWPLNVWDRLNYGIGWTHVINGEKCQADALKVCLLKHVAIFYVAKAKPLIAASNYAVYAGEDRLFTGTEKECIAFVNRGHFTSSGKIEIKQY